MKSGPKASGSLLLNLQTRSGHPQSKNYLFPHPSIPSRLGEGKTKGPGLSLGPPRPTGGERVGVRGLVFSGLILALISLGSGWAGEQAPLTVEQKEVASAAKRYLDAEVKQDYKAVFKSLYPGSEYCRANGFQAYVTEARSSPVRIASYRILNIRIFPENPEKEKYPNLESFARVEVDVTIGDRDSGQKALVNYDFPFVKEGGRWYKL